MRKRIRSSREFSVRSSGAFPLPGTKSEFAANRRKRPESALNEQALARLRGPKYPNFGVGEVFPEKRRARRLPVSNRQIPTRRKSCAADKVSLCRNRPAGIERLRSTSQTNNVRRPGFAGRRTFLRSKTRRANLYAPSPQAPPCAYGCAKRGRPYAQRLDAPRIFAWARVCVCTNDASAPLANRRGCAGFAACTTYCRGLSPSCVRRIACVKIAFL